MSKHLAILATVATGLVACGADTCSSKAAEVKELANGCDALQAGAQLTIDLRLCPTCSESSPSCSATFTTDSTGSRIELSPTFQECQANAGCPASGCDVQPVSCTLNQPLVAGTYEVQYPAQNGGLGTTTVQIVPSGGAQSCTL